MKKSITIQELLLDISKDFQLNPIKKETLFNRIVSELSNKEQTKKASKN